MRIINPATGELVAEVGEDDRVSITSKFQRAKSAQKDWARTNFAERSACIAAFGRLVRREQDQLAETLTREMGKPLRQAHNELAAFQERIDFFLNHTQAVLEPEVVLREDRLEEIISHEPLGVVGNISAWNYPYFVGGNVFLPALLCGNAVLYKPSELATLSGLAMTRLMHEAGVPEGCFASVVGGPSAGSLLLDQPLNGLFFTGSVATGRLVAAAASRRFIPLGLELGGKDPAYAADDVDAASAAAAIADGAFYNAGQSCCAVERVYVHAQIWDAFLEAFLQAVRALKVGDPMLPETSLGPLARGEAQLEHLEAQISDAKARGARVLIGGSRLSGPGFFFEPTVLVDVNHDMLVMREETFGPLIGLMKVESDAQALELMNDTEYGLTAAVYTADAKRAEQLLSELAVGSAYWNCCDRVSPRLPWSGRKNSGLGSTLSTYGIQAFTEPKAWHKRLG